MRNYFLLILLFCCSAYGGAQKLNRNYSFHPQEEGNVYFIHPLKGYESKNKGAVKMLEYDITYLSGKDSATYTFTYFSENAFKIDSVIISDNSGKYTFTGPANMYYLQPKRNIWQQRAAITIPYEILVQLYQSSLPYKISLVGNKNVDYEIKPKTWEKQSKMVTKVFEIIKYNN